MTISPDSLPSGDAAAGAKLDSIQYLRAVAAAVVVLSHSANSLLGHTSHLIDLDYGAYGVDIFFVVSGFVMFYTTFDTGMRPGSFFVKRLTRIFPLYFILSTVMYVLVASNPSSFNHESADPIAFVQSILFIPHWNPRIHDLQPIIGQGWTLNYEMFFYALFAASLFVRSKFNGLLVLPVIGALVVVGQLHPIDNPASITYTSALMLEFCLGIAVAACFVIPSRRSLRWPVLFLILLGVITTYIYAFHAAAYGSEAVRPAFVGLPCAMLVAALVAIERGGWLPRIAMLSLIGDASYSLYLAHGFMLGLGRRLWQHLITVDSVLTHAIFIAGILIASVVAAIFIYRNVERPVGRRLADFQRQLSARSKALGRTADSK